MIIDRKSSASSGVTSITLQADPKQTHTVGGLAGGETLTVCKSEALYPKLDMKVEKKMKELLPVLAELHSIPG